MRSTCVYSFVTPIADRRRNHRRCGVSGVAVRTAAYALSVLFFDPHMLLLDESDDLDLIWVQCRSVGPALLHLKALTSSSERAQSASCRGCAGVAERRRLSVASRAVAHELGEEAREECFHGRHARANDPDVELHARPVCRWTVVPSDIGGDREDVEGVQTENRHEADAAMRE